MTEPAPAETPVHVAFDPAPRQRGACVDTPLVLTLDRPPRLGAAGALSIRRTDGTLADRVDLADPASYRKAVGGAESDAGVPHRFHYYPALVDGDRVAIHLHEQLEYDQTYEVTIDPGFLVGHPGLDSAAGWRFSTRTSPPPDQPAALTVAADGTGDFRTVQGAIDAVPRNNPRPVVITVEPGAYAEIVYVRPDKPFITVRGRDRERTVLHYPNNNILNGESAAGYCVARRLDVPDRHNCWRAAFGVDADDFTLSTLTIRNTTPKGGSQAEAFRGNGERIHLDRVTAKSFQDTLRLQGTGFVQDSLIEGDVDVVWGVGTVFLERCELRSLGPGYGNQARNDADHAGHVFVDSVLTRADGVPDGSVYLARTATEVFPHSQAVFLNTRMDAHIAAEGWQVTPEDGDAAAVRFWEYASTDLAGDPLPAGQRARCSRQLTAEEAARWSDPAFVLDGWEPPRKPDAVPVSDTDVEALITVDTWQDVRHRRDRLIDYVWKGEGLPAELPAVDRDVRAPQIDGLRAGRFDRVTTRLGYGVVSISYLAWPGTRPNGHLAIYYTGHGDPHAPPYDRPLLTTVQALLDRGYPVGVVDLPFLGWNEPYIRDLADPSHLRRSPDHAVHETFAAYESPGFSALTFFLDPLAALLNHADAAYGPASVSLIGLSGGGWAATLYAAVDERVTQSFPVAGSWPFYLRPNPGGKPQFGDWEQRRDSLPGFYGIAGYLDLYVLGGAGHGRRQRQILNRHDPACFPGVPQHDYSDAVRRRVSRLGDGRWDLLQDTTHREHTLSPYALSVILADLEEREHAPDT